LAVLFGNTDFAIYSFERDCELEKLLIEKVQFFWTQYVLKDLPPPTQSESDCNLLFKKSSPKIPKEATIDIVENIAHLQRLSFEIDQREKEVSTRTQLIMNFLQEADTLTYQDQILATWKSTNPAKRFDAKGFAAHNPLLFTQFQTQGEASRRFVLKKGVAHDHQA